MKTISLIVGDITRFGGTERAVTNLANLLINKYKVCIVSLYHPVSSHLQFKLNEDVQIAYLKLEVPKNIIQRNFQYLILVNILRKHIVITKTDFLISTAHAVSFILPFVVLFRKTKSIAAEHIARRSLPFVSKLLQRILYPFIDAVVVLSPSAREKYSFCNRVYIIPNSLPFSSTLKSQQNNKVIIFVGRISIEKGVDRLIDVALKLRDNIDGWKIKIFGNGSYEDECRVMIDKLKLNDILFLNNAVNDIQKEYLNSDILIMTSRFEAFPMVLLEAKACGLPLIAYDCPEGPREIIRNGVDGFLIEDGNVTSMVEKLRLLMSDDSLRKTFAENAVNGIEEYKDEVIKRKWETLFENH